MEMLKNILFIDIETVPLAENFSALPDGLKEHWRKKTRLFRNSDAESIDPESAFEERAGIFSEFAKVVCIGIGYLTAQGEQWQIRLKSISHDDEKVLLNKFITTLARFSERVPDFRFCGHNIKEFDIPFLCRRMLIHGMELPRALQLSGRKPWEVSHIDTLELWRFGDHKNFTSLALLAEVLGIPTPKDDLDGSRVGPTYWQEHDLRRISTYCLKDVYTSCRVYLRLTGSSELVPAAIYAEEDRSEG